jgi:hypothetical protein
MFEGFQFLFRVPLAPEQHPVQIFTPESADEPLDKGMGEGHVWHRLNRIDSQNP